MMTVIVIGTGYALGNVLMALATPTICHVGNLRPKFWWTAALWGCVTADWWVTTRVKL